VGGTVFLVLLGGAAGTFGGLLYGAMRRRLAWAGSSRGLVFGVVTLALFGSVLVEGSNPDFDRFGSPIINVAMFASLFVFFGVLIAPVYEALDAAVPDNRLGFMGSALALAQTAGLALMAPATAIVAAALILDGDDNGLKGLIVVGIFAYLVIAAASSAAARRFPAAQRGAGARAIAASAAPIAPALLVGLTLDVSELFSIF
jgi:hypothetical protein